MNPCTAQHKLGGRTKLEGKDTESEKSGGQAKSAASQEETPRSHPGPTAEAKPEDKQRAGAREAEHDRRSGPQKPDNPRAATETSRNKNKRGEAQARASPTADRPKARNEPSGT